MRPGVNISIEANMEEFNRLILQLGRSNIERASKLSINRAIRSSNTAYRRLIRDNYKLMYADTKDLVQMQYARSKAVGAIKGRVKPLSLSRFNPTFIKQGEVLSIRSLRNKESGRRELSRKSRKARRKDKAGGGVSFEIKKGQKKTIPFAFFTESSKNAGINKQVFARGVYHNNEFKKQKGRYPIQALKSVSPFGMLSREDFSKQIKKEAITIMTKEFDRQIERMLKK